MVCAWTLEHCREIKTRKIPTLIMGALPKMTILLTKMKAIMTSQLWTWKKKARQALKEQELC